METTSTMSRSARALRAIMAIVLALSGVLGVEALTADEAHAAQAQPKVTLASPANVQLKKGEKCKIQVKVSKGAKVTYTSSKKSVVTVSKKGVVTAKNPGSATVTVKAKKGKKSAAKKVSVKVVKATPQAATHKQAPAKAQEPVEQSSSGNYLVAVGSEKAAAEKAAREAAEREAAEKAAREAAEREAAEKAAREAAEREAAEKAAREAAEREAAEKAAREAAEREAAEKAAREAAEREAAEKAAREAAEREAAEKAAREAAEREAAEKAAREAVANAAHSLLFTPNGASGKAFVLDFKGNGTITIPENNNTRAGYKFTGWNTKEDGSGTSYAVSASFKLPDEPSLHVFYAQWKAINGECTENGKVYYYDGNGNKLTGWQTVNGAKRYYDPANGGARVGAGERKISSQALFGTTSNWYLFDANGTMLTGWQSVNGQTKFFRTDGTRAQGEVYIAKGELGSAVGGYRYFDTNGVIQLGWRTINGVDKYFELNDGVRASGIFAVPHDGGSNTYCFNTSTGARMANVVQGGYYFRPGDGVGLSLATIANGQYEIVSALGNKYLDVSAGSTADCANVQIWECTHTNAQVFTIQKASGNYYKIINVNSGKAVDVTGGDARNGINIHQYTWNGTDAQLWLPVCCNGGVVFFNKATNTVMDVSAAICANGTNVQSWEFNDSAAQVWRLYKHDPYAVRDRFNMTKEERETADSIWNSYCAFRASKGVPAVTRSDYCTQLACDTCRLESAIGAMQHEIAIPQDKRLAYSDILQYSTWRKAGPSAVETWMKSEGHHRMMRNNNGTTEAGVGVYFDGQKWWYTIVYNFNGYNQYQGTLW